MKKTVKKRILKKPIRYFIYILISITMLYCLSKILINLSKPELKRNLLKVETTMAKQYENQQELLTLKQYQDINENIVLRLIFNNDVNYNVPVVNTFSEDDCDYYMNHNIYNNYDSLGSAFIDEYCDYGFGNNTIINGHSSYQDNRMFTFLKNYKDKSYFNKYSVFSIENELGFYDYKIIFISCYNVNHYVDYLYGWANNNIDENELKLLLEKEENNILNSQNVESDKEEYITLITCDMKDKNLRYVLFAKRI